MKNKVGIFILVAVITITVVYFLYIRPRKIFKNPVNGIVTEGFGPRINPVTGATEVHNGVDLRAATGTSVRPPLPGKVIKVYENSTGGKQMLVQHAGGWITGYAHLSQFEKKEGDTVKQSDVIALSGATGSVTAPHLHFTLTDPKGNHLDPSLYFNKQLA